MQHHFDRLTEFFYQCYIQEILLISDVTEGVRHVGVKVVPAKAVLLRRRGPHLEEKLLLWRKGSLAGILQN